MPSDDGAVDIFPEVDGVEVLQKTMIFAKLGFEETRRLSEILQVERFPRGHIVIEQDSLGEALYIVRKGEVAIYRRNARGERDLLNRLPAGEIFGEMSLIDDLLVSADVEVTSEEVEVVKIPRGRFESLLRGDEGLSLKIYRGFCHTLSERLRRLNQRFADLDHSHSNPTSH
jgi:CRP-like cAMP-binding protein